jgi:hypothetical protein
MSTPVISSLSYKDTSDDEVDAVLTKLKCPRTLIGARSPDFESKHCQLFGSDGEPAECRHAHWPEKFFAPCTCRARPNLLKKPEQFEYDYDNNNYSDYIEDVSVHGCD